MQSSFEMIERACKLGVAIPAFNIAHLPMTEPVIRAVVDTDSVALIEVARPDWEKFGAESPAAVMEEYRKYENPNHVRIHLDHIPVVDEDEVRVDYISLIRESIGLGYQSVMVDGSRLDLEDNIEATGRVAEIAHESGIPCEAELGAVLGHSAGPPPPYDEIFESGMGFTNVDEAVRFVAETRCDWLSIAFGNIHGALSGALKDQKKVEARLNLEHLDRLYDATGIPLVLHGGSGVKRDYLLQAMKRGIAKVNVGTEVRQAYEAPLRDTGSVEAAQKNVYDRTVWLIRDYFELAGLLARMNG